MNVRIPPDTGNTGGDPQAQGRDIPGITLLKEAPDD
jgi:hypothetical protein